MQPVFVEQAKTPLIMGSTIAPTPPVAEMSLDDISTQLAQIAPHIGLEQKKLEAAQFRLAGLQNRAEELITAAQKQDKHFLPPAGIETKEEIDIEIVGDSSHLALMAQNWAALTASAITIDSQMLKKNLLPFIRRDGNDIYFIKGFDVPVKPVLKQTIHFDFEKLATLPLPKEPPEPEIIPEAIPDPLERVLEGEG